MNWSETLPDVWFTVIFLLSHSLQWRAHELYTAATFFISCREWDLRPHRANILRKLTSTRLSVLAHLRPLALINKRSHAIMCGTIPSMNLNRMLPIPPHIFALLPTFLQRAMPNPHPSSYPYTHHMLPYTPHMQVYHLARHHTQIQANCMRLCPEAYPVSWLTWHFIEFPSRQQHPANLHQNVRYILVECIDSNDNRIGYGPRTGWDLSAHYFHMCFPRTISIRPGPESNGITMMTRLVPVDDEFDTDYHVL